MGQAAALGESDKFPAKRHLQAQSEQQVSHLLDFKTLQESKVELRSKVFWPNIKGGLPLRRKVKQTRFQDTYKCSETLQGNFIELTPGKNLSSFCNGETLWEPELEFHIFVCSKNNRKKTSSTGNHFKWIFIFQRREDLLLQDNRPQSRTRLTGRREALFYIRHWNCSAQHPVHHTTTNA